VGPVSDDVASRSSFLRLGQCASGKTDRYSSAGVGLQSPVLPRVGRVSHAVERGMEHRR